MKEDDCIQQRDILGRDSSPVEDVRNGALIPIAYVMWITRINECDLSEKTLTFESCVISQW